MNRFFCVCIFACAVTIPSNSCITHWIIWVTSGRMLEITKVLYSYSFCENRQPSRWVKYNPLTQCKRLNMSSVLLLDTRAPHTNKRYVRRDSCALLLSCCCSYAALACILAFLLSSVLFSHQGSNQQNSWNAQTSAEANNIIFWNSSNQGLLTVELFLSYLVNEWGELTTSFFFIRTEFFSEIKGLDPGRVHF